jgi:hypothetical protein
MRDRIIGALDTGCRCGELLKIRNEHGLGTSLDPNPRRELKSEIAGRSEAQRLDRAEERRKIGRVMARIEGGLKSSTQDRHGGVYAARTE